MRRRRSWTRGSERRCLNRAELRVGRGQGRRDAGAPFAVHVSRSRSLRSSTTLHMLWSRGDPRLGGSLPRARAARRRAPPKSGASAGPRRAPRYSRPRSGPSSGRGPSVRLNPVLAKRLERLRRRVSGAWCGSRRYVFVLLKSLHVLTLRFCPQPCCSNPQRE